MTAYADMVEQLVALHFPRDVAEARVREEFPHLAPTPADVAKDASILERAEQKAIVDLLRAHGCSVYCLSQSRASKQTPGIADLFVFAPRYQLSFWFEIKRPVGGVQSPAQKLFEQPCTQTRTRYIIGGKEEAWELIHSFG